MDYKKSKFNCAVFSNGNAVIFNSLTNSLTVLPEEIYLTETFNVLSKDTFELMKEQGIIVNNDVDEDQRAFTKYLDLVDNKQLNLIILPTMMCNFRCPYCYEQKNIGKMSDEVIDSIINFVRKKISTASNIHVSWFGGEPLLCIDIIEKISKRIMDLAKSYHKFYSSSITTNGYLLDLETFKKLYRLKVVSYQITIDGRKQYHDKTRPLANGGSTYDVIIHNLKVIKEHVKSQLFTILIRTNLTKDTLSDLDNHIAELTKYFQNDKRFSFFFKKVGNWGGESVKNILDNLIDEDNCTIDPLYEKIINAPKMINIAQFSTFYSSPLCYASRKDTYTINPLGEVMKCTVQLDSKKNLIGKLDAEGNLLTEVGFERWLYPGELHKQKNQKCENCSYYANCFGIRCPVSFVFHGEPIRCDGIENELMSYYLYDNSNFKTLKEMCYER